MRFVSEVERTVPVECWTAGGIQVWPIARNWHWGLTAQAPRSARDTSHLLDRARHASSLIDTAVHSARVAVLDHRHQARLGQPAHAVLLGDGYSRVLFDGSWYDRLCEPIVEALDGLGRASLHVELGTTYRGPRHNRARYIQSALNRHWLATRSRAKTAVEHMQLPGFEEYESLAEQHRQIAASPSQLKQQAAVILSASGFFERVLAATGARMGFIVDYFNAYGMAYCLACARQSVLSVEIQHGTQDRDHLGYAGWSRVPGAGFDLLPRRFWHWSPQEAEVVNSWAWGGPHASVVGGNPWLLRWQLRPPQDPRPSTTRQARVLVSLQPSPFLAAVLRELATAMLGRGTAFEWHLRLHPTSTARDWHAVKGWARNHGCEVHRAEAVPLYRELQEADVHLTHSSAVVLDAELFGVPSVALSPDCAAFFPRHAERGWVRTASGRTLASEIQRAAAARLSLRRVSDVTPPPLSETVAHFLGEAMRPSASRARQPFAE